MPLFYFFGPSITFLMVQLQRNYRAHQEPPYTNRIIDHFGSKVLLWGIPSQTIVVIPNIETLHSTIKVARKEVVHILDPSLILVFWYLSYQHFGNLIKLSRLSAIQEGSL